MTFLLTGEETGGALFMAEISVAPGGGTPPHIHHREDEAFRMLEGSADDPGGRGYNHCIRRRFCISSPWNRSLIQEHRRRLREGAGFNHSGGP